jgi:hypothetical protein
LVELGRAPKDSGAFTTKRLEGSLEVPGPPALALAKMWREEDDLSEDGSTPFSFMWTLADRD